MTKCGKPVIVDEIKVQIVQCGDTFRVLCDPLDDNVTVITDAIRGANNALVVFDRIVDLLTLRERAA